MGLFIDIHAIQTLPPANLNRDENGRPKTSIYGGVPRMRVSSQAWKKAIRDNFRDTLDTGQARPAQPGVHQDDRAAHQP